MNHSDLTDAGMAAALWPDLFEGITGPLNTSAPQGIHEDPITVYHFTADTSLNDTVFAPTPTTSMGTSTIQANHSYPNDTDACAMPAQGLVPPQLVGDPHWTGVSPYATNSAAATRNLVVSPSSSTTPPGSQDGLAWPFGPGQSIYHPTSSFGGSSEGGLVAPEFGANISGITTYQVGWATNEVARPISTAAETFATAAPGKRRRDESHGDRVPVVMPPQKRVRGSKANWILKTARSATRTRHKPAARIPKPRNNYEPKQPVRGAERLATTYSQGFHHRSLLGPSLQQGWAEGAADGQLIWVEGSAEEMAHRTDSTVQQQQQQHKQEEVQAVQQESFEIPRDLKMGCQALLAATQADWARGAVREIRCRLCPAARFRKWRQFKRHCECTETHPLTIYFCENCGDYFARSDACQRHCRDRPRECREAKPEDANAKRRATQRAHDEFIRRLVGYLTTGEDIGMSFSKTIKDVYPDSSKKRIRGSRE